MMFDPESRLILMETQGHLFNIRMQGFNLCCVSTVSKRFASDVEIADKEQEIIKLLLSSATIQEAADQYSPALIANYTYDLVKEYNGYYQNTPILVGDNKEQIARVALSDKVAQVIKTGMGLFRVVVPNRM